MAQHALGSKDNKGLAPFAQRLPPEQMEILRGRGRLANLHIIVRCELKVALDAGARVLGPLAFIPMRQQNDYSGEQSPLVFARGNELVKDDLRAVGKVAELRLPHHQRFRKVSAVSIF